MIPMHAMAQEARNAAVYKNNLGLQPLYLFNQGMRIDYERQLNDPHHWLQMSATGYYADDTDYSGIATLLFGDDRIKKLSGAGVEVNYKYFFLKRRFLYVSAGVSHRYFHTLSHAFGYASYHEDGLTFYRLNYGLQSQDFNRVGFNSCFGVQTSPYKRFFVDGYVGLGLCRSFYDRDGYYPDPANINGLSYSGLTFTVGMRAGMRF
jgi:hypothetical protein